METLYKVLEKRHGNCKVSAVQRISYCLLLFGLAASMAAQEPIKWGDVTVQASVRSRLELWDWFGEGEASRYGFLGNQARLGFSQSKANLDWQLEFMAPVLLGLPDDAVQGTPQGVLGLGGNYFVANDRKRNAAMVFPKNAFVRFKNLGGDKTQSLRLGRFEYIDGSEVVPKDATLGWLKVNRINQRVLGSFGWSHVGRSFDGAHYVLNRPGGNLTVMAAVPTRGVFQVDGWGWNRAAVGYAAYTVPVKPAKGAAELRLFSMYYHDWRRVLKTDNRPAAARAADLANIRLGMFGGHYLHAHPTASGTVDITLWGAAQTGRWGRLDHRSGAFLAEVGFQPAKVAWRPWIRGAYYYGSGDGDPNDSTHGSFFQVMPTPRPFARTPFYDMINNRDAMAQVVLRPKPVVSVTGEFHNLSLASSNDLWYLGGGVFQPWSFGYIGRPSQGKSGLANLYDVSVDYKVNAHTSLTFYFGYMQALGVTEAIYPRGSDGRFGYVEWMYKF